MTEKKRPPGFSLDDDAPGDDTPFDPGADDDVPDVHEGDSDLALLRADLAERTVEEIVLPVPGRPGYETVHAAEVSGRQLDGFRKRAKRKTGLDGALLASLLVAHSNVAIRKGGRRLVDDDGDPLVFSSAAFLALTEANTAADAARAFYGRDGDLDAAGQAILAASGWGDAAEAIDEENPTKRRA